MYQGNIALGDTIDIFFTTRRFSTGAPYALGGSAVISAYVDNSVTQITAGITLTVDFDGVTGLNHVRVVASGGNGFAAGDNVFLVITTGTVDSVSVVGEVVASFSIEARVPGTNAQIGTAAGTAVWAASLVRLKTNTASQYFKFSMRDESGDPLTGLTISGSNAQVAIDGSPFANISGTVTEIGNGVYRCAPAAGDLNGADCTFRFAGTNAKETHVHIITVP